MSWIDFLSDFEIVFYYPEKSIPRFTSRLKSFSREVACYFFVVMNKFYMLGGSRRLASAYTTHESFRLRVLSDSFLPACTVSRVGCCTWLLTARVRVFGQSLSIEYRDPYTMSFIRSRYVHPVFGNL